MGVRLVFDQRTGQLQTDGFDMSSVDAEAFEARWRDVKARHGRVRLYINDRIGTIGEMLFRYFAMCAEEPGDGSLRVTLPAQALGHVERVANPFANEYIGICPDEDLEFWTWVLLNHRSELEGDVLRYESRNAFPAYLTKAGSIEHHFTDEQVERGEAALKAMGVTGPFVCLAARNAQYNKRTGHFLNDAYSHRNMEFKDYGKTIAWLGERGIQCLKMGRFEDPIDPIPNCIDYSAHHASDFMDLYAFSRCEFAVSCLSGITALANLFAKPLLVVDVAQLSFGLGACRYTEHDRFLPKHYYIRDLNKRRVKRPLTLRDVFEAERDCDIFDEHFVRRDIEWSDDTEDEILDAVKEMVARIEGTWTDRDEDEELLDRWWTLHDDMAAFQAANERNWIGGPVPFPPATRFLRAHPYLVE